MPGAHSAASPDLDVADVMVLCPQTSFLVKHEGGNNDLMMRIWLGAWEDRETMAGGTEKLCGEWFGHHERLTGSKSQHNIK